MLSSKKQWQPKLETHDTWLAFYLDAYVNAIKNYVDTEEYDKGHVLASMFYSTLSADLEEARGSVRYIHMIDANKKLLPPGWKFVDLLQSKVEKCAAVFDRCARPNFPCKKYNVYFYNPACPSAQGFFGN